MINDFIRGVSLAFAARAFITMAVVIFQWRRDNRKPGCHCWACRRLNKAEGGDQQMILELGCHYHLWETRPPVEPDRGRS